MATYGLYGLVLDSGLAFPELPERPGEADVVLELGPVESPRPAGEERPYWFHSEGEEAWFDWREVAVVRISGGHAIRVDACAGVDVQGLRSAMLGPVFSVLLVQRGLYPLHASVVSIGGRAVAFTGPTGQGKSTTALAFHRHGHAVLADDVAALDVSGDEVRIHPGFPQLKLEPELLEELGERPGELPRVNPIEEKRARPLPGPFRGEPTPLDRVYVLETGEPALEGPLDKAEAFFLAQRNGHRPGLLGQVLDPATLMDRCGRLASRVPFFRLRRPASLARLEELVRRVEDHLGSA